MNTEDCIQQCGVVFARCVRVYHRREPSPRMGKQPVDKGRGKVNNAAWFMSIYKRALVNEFNMLATRVGRSYRAENEFVIQSMNRSEGWDYNPGLLLASLSSELREVLQVLAGAPTELLEMLLHEQRDEIWSRRLCRLCRISTPNETIVTELRDLAKARLTP